jgi:ribonuclease HI
MKETKKGGGSALKQVDIYTDGACSGNPGPGGYGTILTFGTIEKELSAGFISTTNNRMELTAAIVGLQALKEPCAVTLYSDSKYLVDAITLGWVEKWRKNGWMRNKKEAAANVDLWETLLSLLQIHSVTWVWVKGHAGHPQNERCDRLAVAATQKSRALGRDTD